MRGLNAKLDGFLKQNVFVLLQRRGGDATFCKYRSRLTGSSIGVARVVPDEQVRATRW